MIRRDVPRGGAQPTHWLLISQIEHARISHQFAEAWDPSVLPAGVREEFLAAVLHHDDGWQDWQTAPRIDPEHGRPYGFTEMPPTLAQEIWSRSIDACQAIGPLAGWIVASHFIQLQGKQDDDFKQWARWLGEQDRRRTEWFAEWRQRDPSKNATSVAERCLHLLQEFDWLSLWLCCRAPADERDPCEKIELGEAANGFGPYRLMPGATAGVLSLLPWPFAGEQFVVEAHGRLVPVGRYDSVEQMPGVDQTVRWRLVPGS